MDIFIVEDSRLLKEKLVGLIKEISGFNIVGTASESEDAVQAISSKKPDIIILDIRLKRGSGIEVLRGIRTSSYQPIVIVFTHYPGLVFRKKKLLDGVRFLFDKATGFENMLDTLKKLVHNDTSRRLAIG